MGAKRLRALGGLALAVCFVLPAVRACDESIVPARELVDRGQGPIELGLTLAVFLMPYLFGAFVALGALLARHARAFDTGIFAVFGFEVGTMAVAIGHHAIHEGLSPADSIGVLIVLIGGTLGWRAFHRPDGAVSLRFVMAVCCLIWFGGFSLGPTSLIGVWIATVASLVIAVAAVLEARRSSDVRGWRFWLGLISGGSAARAT